MNASLWLKEYLSDLNDFISLNVQCTLSHFENKCYHEVKKAISGAFCKMIAILLQLNTTTEQIFF